MNYRAQAPANQFAGTEETDSTGGLFSRGYVFGQPILEIENDPGESTVEAAAPAGDDQTNWVTAPPETDPTPIASTKLHAGADSRWLLWSQSASSVAVALPDGSDIRSLWVPNVPIPMQISLGFAGGGVMYSITLSGGEIVPIPKGTKMLTLSAGAQLKPDIWLYATADIFTPNKTGVNGAPLAISGATSQYDSMILGTAGVRYYFPLSDTTGALYAQDYGPNHVQGSPQNGVTFGSIPLINDGGSSAQFNGAPGTYIGLPAVPGAAGAAPWSVEMWFYFGGLGQGTQNSCCLIEAGSGTGGPMRLGILRSNSHLALGANLLDKGPATYVSQGIHHLVAQCDGSFNGEYWLDGVKVYSSTGNANDYGNWTLANGAYLGGTPNSGTSGADQDSLVGEIAKVTMYSRFLTPTEIASHYSNHL